MLLVEDREHIISDLVSTPVADVFIRADANGELPQEYRSLLDTYQILDRSQANLLHLVRASLQAN